MKIYLSGNFLIQHKSDNYNLTKQREDCALRLRHYERYMSGERIIRRVYGSGGPAASVEVGRQSRLI